MIRQPDGKILIGGAFEVAGGRASNGVARFNGDGTIDDGFMSAVGGAVVSALALQEDGKILVGGFSIGADALVRERRDHCVPVARSAA